MPFEYSVTYQINTCVQDKFWLCMKTPKNWTESVSWRQLWLVIGSCFPYYCVIRSIHEIECVVVRYACGVGRLDTPLSFLLLPLSLFLMFNDLPSTQPWPCVVGWRDCCLLSSRLRPCHYITPTICFNQTNSPRSNL